MNLINMCNCIVVLLTYFLNTKVSLAELDCELVENCPFAKNLLSKRYIPAPRQIWTLFKISKCGYEEETRRLKIWCPKFINCRTPDKEFGTCMSKKSCADLALFLKTNITAQLKNKIPFDEHVCDPQEDIGTLVCCPWPITSFNFEKKERVERKKRDTDHAWFGYSNNGNNLFDGGQFYQINKGFESEGLNFNLPSFNSGSEKNVFTQQNMNFYDQLKSGQTSQMNQLKNSLQKQNNWFQAALESNSKKLSDAQQNFGNGFLNSLSGFRGKTDYSKYNLTEETSATMQEICMTPDNFEGICKQFRRCPSFVKALSNINNTDSIQIEYLKTFRCNSTESTGDNTQVCCSENLIVLPSAATRTVESKTENEDSTNNPLDSLSNICGRQSLDDKIIGGSTTGLAEFPWTAVLYYTTSKGLSFGCGGTIISNRYIITAAHCVNLDILKQAGLRNLQQIVLGEYDRRNETDCIYTPYGSDCADPPQFFGVERIMEHEHFRSNATPNDIALVRLDRDITFNDFVRPICLPTTGSLNLNGNETFTITGWGRTETGESSPIKRKARLPFISKENCSQLGPLADGQMCLGSGKGTDSCKGDSGGPVMLHTLSKSSDLVVTLVGVISFGFGRCGSTTSVSTYVPHYMDWILKNIL